MPKLRIDQLEKTLSGSKAKLAPVYLISGDEPLLVQEACDTVRQAARKQGFLERELHHTDAGFQWEALNHSANSISLFAEKKIIEIRVHNGKPGDAGSKALLEYCQAPSEDNLLLLELPKIDKRSQNTKWFKAIENLGAVVLIWPIGIQQMPHWINARMKRAGLTADAQAVEILCAKTEGNLLAASQEIEKLKLVTDDNHVDAHTMANAVTTSARYDVFGLADKALSGDSRAAVTHLQGLRGEGTEPTIVLWALSREIRALTQIKEAMDNGKNFDFVAKSAGIWDNRKALIRQALQRLTVEQLHALIRKVSLADKVIKGMSKGDIWNVLLDIVLSVSGTQTLSARSQHLLLSS